MRCVTFPRKFGVSDLTNTTFAEDTLQTCYQCPRLPQSWQMPLDVLYVHTKYKRSERFQWEGPSYTKADKEVVLACSQLMSHHVYCPQDATV